MCFKKKNVLIEIKFPKTHWPRKGVERYVKLMLLGGMLLDENVFSQYHTMIYKDIRLYKNYNSAYDRRDNVVWVYGDRR